MYDYDNLEKCQIFDLASRRLRDIPAEDLYRYLEDTFEDKDLLEYAYELFRRAEDLEVGNTDIDKIEELEGEKEFLEYENSKFIAKLTAYDKIKERIEGIIDYTTSVEVVDMSNLKGDKKEINRLNKELAIYKKSLTKIKDLLTKIN